MAHKRTYPVRWNVVDRLREAKNWTIRELAEHVGINVRVLRCVMNANGNTYLRVIGELAAALEVEPDDLRADINPPTATVRAFIRIDPAIDISIQRIKELAGLKDVINVVSIIYGGSVLIVEVTQDDAFLLLNSASNGALAENNIMAVIVPTRNSADIFRHFVPSDLF